MRGLLVILLFTVLLVGCWKTPDNIISEDDMSAILADMYKAEAMVEEDNNKYYNDSLKMMVRQSVMMKHNVTQEQYDTSIVWYAHNLDVYKDVYENTIKQLDTELNEIRKGDYTAVAPVAKSDKIKPSVPRYRAVGDTADIWENLRTWALLPGFSRNIITFDLKPDKECMKGDRYELAFKLANQRQSMKVFLGIDYKDGSTAYLYRTVNNEGWKHYKLQADTTRDVTRIYGYMSYASKPKHVVYVDSVELLRTHLDRKSYSNIIHQQNWIGKKEDKGNTKDDLKPKVAADKNLEVKESFNKKVEEKEKNPRLKKLKAQKDNSLKEEK